MPADVLVGLHGAQLYNALFMPAHKALVEVRPYGFWGVSEEEGDGWGYIRVCLSCVTCEKGNHSGSMLLIKRTCGNHGVLGSTQAAASWWESCPFSGIR